MKAKTLMPLLLLLILFSTCKKTTAFREINLIVNHYQRTATGNGAVVVYVTQSGANIGTNNWENFYSNIEGFRYVPGYVYDLDVVIKTIPNPPADGSAEVLILKSINSQTKVDANTTFEVALKMGQINFMTGTGNTDFKILNKIPIICGNVCSDLTLALGANSTEVIGKFVHSGDGSARYLLKEVKVK